MLTIMEADRKVLEGNTPVRLHCWKEGTRSLPDPSKMRSLLHRTFPDKFRPFETNHMALPQGRPNDRSISAVSFKHIQIFGVDKFWTRVRQLYLCMPGVQVSNTVPAQK